MVHRDAIRDISTDSNFTAKSDQLSATPSNANLARSALVLGHVFVATIWQYRYMFTGSMLLDSERIKHPPKLAFLLIEPNTLLESL